MKLSNKAKQAILAHARAEYPRECCGVLIGGDYRPCTNIVKDAEAEFEIAPDELLDIEEITAIVHSHPNGSAKPSALDRVQMAAHGVPWVIVGLDAVNAQLAIHTPAAPLIGREYVHGVQDCYSIVRDYYACEFGALLPDFARKDGWWEDVHAASLYVKNFSKAGFVRLPDDAPLQKGDVLLCRVGRTHHVNHAVVYLGGSVILHHPHGGLSKRELYSDGWRRRTVMVVRYKGAWGK